MACQTCAASLRCLSGPCGFRVPQVNGPAAELMPECAWGLHTRAVDPLPEPWPGQPEASEGTAAAGGAQAAGGQAAGGSESNADAGGCGVSWGERFVLRLPPELSEQLLCPAPGDNQFEGVPLQVGEGARGQPAGALDLLPVPHLWLQLALQWTPLRPPACSWTCRC
jgi:hypothetical protein